MRIKLSDIEINKRLVRLRNLEMLHKKARKRIVSQDKEIKYLRLRIKELEEKDKQKDKIIQSLMLQMEEIEIKVFGKKNNKDDEPPKEKSKADRESSSYKRPIPHDITKIKNHSINNCSTCDSN